MKWGPVTILVTVSVLVMICAPLNLGANCHTLKQFIPPKEFQKVFTGDFRSGVEKMLNLIAEKENESGSDSTLWFPPLLARLQRQSIRDIEKEARVIVGIAVRLLGDDSISVPDLKTIMNRLNGALETIPETKHDLKNTKTKFLNLKFRDRIAHALKAFQPDLPDVKTLERKGRLLLFGKEAGMGWGRTRFELYQYGGQFFGVITTGKDSAKDIKPEHSVVLDRIQFFGFHNDKESDRLSSGFQMQSSRNTGSFALVYNLQLQLHAATATIDNTRPDSTGFSGIVSTFFAPFIRHHNFGYGRERIDEEAQGGTSSASVNEIKYWGYVAKRVLKKEKRRRYTELDETPVTVTFPFQPSFDRDVLEKYLKALRGKMIDGE